MRSLTAGAALAAALALALGACGGGEEDNPPVKPDPAFGSQPNFVFVLTDDQPLASFNRRTMPRTFRLLAGAGTRFTNYVDATPICCPARAALLTGQYGHNNGVLNNKPGYEDLRDPDNVLPVWLKRAGYRTGYVGKFLNGYERAVDDNKEVAPGWDEWWTLVGKHSYYDFKVAASGERRKLKFKGEYITDVLSRRAVELVGELSRGDDPFFLQLAQLAPHVENEDSGGRCGTQSVPPPRDANRFTRAPLPHPRSITEDVSDKPSFITGLPPIGPRKRQTLERRWRCRLATLPAVDRGIARVVRALEDAGELGDTVLVFTADNGTFHGEHRLPGGKTLAYREASELPLLIRAPDRYRGGPRAAVSDAAVASVDVVPTIVELAGAETCPQAGECRVLDGRSLVPLLSGREEAWPSRRPILTESDVGKDELKSGRATSCVYDGLRLGHWLFLRHSSIPDLETGVCDPDSEALELYDKARDPAELENLLAGQPGARATAVAERLAAITDELADCAGIRERDPEPDSGNYCR